MQFTSPDFHNKEMIPKEYTCQGKDINPTLDIEGIPPDAKSLALIVDDPDAPNGTFVHWVLFNISITSKIEKNSSPGMQGKNSYGKNGYVGPCPPSGTHRYFFKLYALDIELKMQEGISKEDLEEVMKGHVLDQAELIGLYKKS